jgi:hypothetical protein
MKVANLYYILPHIQAFCATEMKEGDFILSVRWFDLSKGDAIDEQIFDARGKEKSFKTANAIFTFLRGVYPNGKAKLEINFG